MEEGNGEWLPFIDIGPCDSYQMGFVIGQRFAHLIESRVSKDKALQEEMLPFAKSADGHSLIESLSTNNRNKYPRYWNELRGTAEGSGVPFLQVLLLNFRKEIAPFLPEKIPASELANAEECSDNLVLNSSTALVVHNEDASISVIGHVYLVKATLQSGASFTAYTYAGELPSCAFGFNSHGVAFTLNAVPPTKEEVEIGGIGRNFISRDLLEAVSIEDALKRVHLPNISVGHSYNLIDVRQRRILNVETASKNRISVLEVGSIPFFHANMYLHLKIGQANDKSSISRQKRAAELPNSSLVESLSLLGDTSDEKNPIFMQGPILCTLCTAVIDLDQKMLSIYRGNPKLEKVVYLFPLT
ncbi:uncharacterized protein LOC131039339 isoform X1 [Cryptomeria japonica]|uniref:uncharacterized protein LOC131039339 isoform X1 n=1 Tax=Cryptomeria japonica TaxID=3369 RepID=UPI0027D9FEC8|nr:uncharacterized protein LOC131039339 isoform X1 [Cryptomeria japonica]